MFNPFVPNCGAYWRLNLTCLRVFCRLDPQKRLWDLTMPQGSRRTNMSIRNCNICNIGRTRYTTESTDVGCWLQAPLKQGNSLTSSKNVETSQRNSEKHNPGQARHCMLIYADLTSTLFPRVSQMCRIEEATWRVLCWICLCAWKISKAAPRAIVSQDSAICR
jgi:hypothetical protein